MRFWTTFSRWVGGGGTPALGSDSAPLGPPSLSQDNLLVTDRSLNYRETGPTHRIAVAFSGPSGAGSVPADIYLYEENTDYWYRTHSSSISLTPDTITFFDAAMVLSNAKRIQGDMSEPGGEIQCVLVPKDPGSLPPGEYKFSVAPVTSEPSGATSGGTASNVNVVSPIPLPVSGTIGITPVPLPVVMGTSSTVWVPATVGATAASGIIKASTGTFYQAHGFNDRGAKRYLMLFDSATVPADGTSSWFCLRVPGGGTFTLDANRARTFTNGLSWAISSTPSTLTIDAAAQFWVQMEIT